MPFPLQKLSRTRRLVESSACSCCTMRRSSSRPRRRAALISLRCSRNACSASANRHISSRHASIIATRAHCIWMPACASVRLTVATSDMASRFSSLICRATRASSASNAHTLAALTGSQADGVPSTTLSSMVIAVAVDRLARARKAGARRGGGHGDALSKWETGN